MFLFNILWRGLGGGKHLSRILRNCRPMFVATFMLNGGLNHDICLFLFRFLFSVWGGWNDSLFEYPLALSAVWYGLVAASKTLLLDDMVEISFFI